MVFLGHIQQERKICYELVKGDMKKKAMIDFIIVVSLHLPSWLKAKQISESRSSWSLGKLEPRGLRVSPQSPIYAATAADGTKNTRIRAQTFNYISHQTNRGSSSVGRRANRRPVRLMIRILLHQLQLVLRVEPP